MNQFICRDSRGRSARSLRRERNSLALYRLKKKIRDVSDLASHLESFVLSYSIFYIAYARNEEEEALDKLAVTVFTRLRIRLIIAGSFSLSLLKKSITIYK